jgi:hypothetical protein
VWAGRLGGGDWGSLKETILHRSQSRAGRAVPGKDLAGKKVHKEDALPEDEDDEEDVVVHQRAGVKRKR